MICYYSIERKIFMEYYNNDRYKPIETALKKLDLKAVTTEKHGNKTIITVIRANRKRISEGSIKIKPQNEGM